MANETERGQNGIERIGEYEDRKFGNWEDRTIRC